MLFERVSKVFVQGGLQECDTSHAHLIWQIKVFDA
jgi:hypothetical protein